MEEEQNNQYNNPVEEQNQQEEEANKPSEINSEDNTSIDTINEEVTISPDKSPFNTPLQDNASEMQELKERVERRNTKIKELENEIKDLILEIEKHKNEVDRFSELEQNNKEITETNSTLRQQILENESELSINQNELKLLQSRVSSLQEELENNQHILNDFREKAETYQDLEEENLKLATDMEKILEEKHELQSKVSQITEDYDMLQNFLTQSKENLLGIEKENEELRHNKEQLNSRILELQEELDLKKQECINIREESSKNGEDVDLVSQSFNEKLNEKEVLIDDLRQEIRDYKDKIASMVHKEELEKIQADLSAKDKQLSAWEEKYSEKSRNLEKLHLDVETEKTKLRDKIEELQTQLLDTQELKENMSEKEEVIKDFEKREEEFHEALMDNLRIQAEKEDLNDKITELIDQKSVLFERINELKNHDRGHIAIIRRLEAKVADFEKEKQQENKSEEEILKENIENDLLKQRIEELNTEISDQIVKASEAVGRYEVTKDQIEQLKHQVKEVTDKYDLIKQDMERLARKAREEKEELTVKLQETEQKLKDTAEKMSQLEDELEQAKSGGQLKEQVETLKRDLEEQSGIAESLADDMSKSNIELLMAKKETTRLNEEIVGLKRRIKLLRRDLSQR
ncbi:Chromosome partition protein Smc [Candidatus Lokiarchaeum ossiferum]|uniref:Chromosome partition protein Smc n=1 Tax=Candidatus Lokiarchaeum ossiferum TaxID=2951803 RepID=A0ABY6HS80_9ARCH|nr:Chromosome partition protein Smc [Candidatus Lokiarchaeum sp. B-35]